MFLVLGEFPGKNRAINEASSPGFLAGLGS